jgi:CSLREA domain-containing protein
MAVFRIMVIVAFAAVCAALAFGMPGFLTPAQASSFTVTKPGDTNDGSCTPADCSLREAVIAANGHSGPDTITVPAGTYMLTIAGANEDQAATGDLDITDDVTISGAGPGSTIIDGAGLDRVFEVYPGLAIGSELVFGGLTIQHGDADRSNGGGIAIDSSGGSQGIRLTNVLITGNHGLDGGGVENRGSTIIENSTITGNTAASGPWGGGIFNTGTLTINNTTISGNSADLDGGGIYNLDGHLVLNRVTLSGNSSTYEGGGLSQGGGTVDITNSTFSGNTATNRGGGIYNGNNANPDMMTLLNVTMSGDSAPAGAAIFHDASVGTLNLKNTIVAGNGPDCSGAIVSQGHNIASDGTCSLSGSGDMPNTDPMLDPLADYGGPTKTHRLQANSPALNTASNDCPPPATDQRATARPQGPACDIGSFELEGGATPTPTPSPTPTPATVTPVDSHTPSPTVTPTTPATSRKWGDFDCNGSLGIGDAQKIARHLIGLSVSQGPDCPQPGQEVAVNGTPRLWGDLDCQNGLTIGDAQKTARKLINLPVSQADGCPLPGATVQVFT